MSLVVLPPSKVIEVGEAAKSSSSPAGAFSQIYKSLIVQLLAAAFCINFRRMLPTPPEVNSEPVAPSLTLKVVFTPPKLSYAGVNTLSYILVIPPNLLIFSLKNYYLYLSKILLKFYVDHVKVCLSITRITPNE